MPEATLFTDGACAGNPGPGGWAFLLRTEAGPDLEGSGGALETTNNQMEMQAAIEGLRALPPATSVTVVTDSQYLQKGMTQWLSGWKRRGWLTAAGDPVKNRYLWQQLDTLCSERVVMWQWVRGHNGHPENNRVDALARAAIVRPPTPASPAP